MSFHKDVLVWDCWSVESESWCFTWESFFNSNEFQDYLDLWSCLCRHEVHSDLEDSCRWNGLKEDSFCTKEMYNILAAALLECDFISFSWIKLWWKVVPSKIVAFS